MNPVVLQTFRTVIWVSWYRLQLFISSYIKLLWNLPIVNNTVKIKLKSKCVVKFKMVAAWAQKAPISCLQSITKYVSDLHLHLLLYAHILIFKVDFYCYSAYDHCFFIYISLKIDGKIGILSPNLKSKWKKIKITFISEVNKNTWPVDSRLFLTYN